MDNSHALPLLGGFLLGALVAAGVVFAWLSRRVQAERRRALQADQSHQQVVQQVMLARKQIEQLQRECHELRLAVRPAPRQAPAPEPAQDPAEATRRYAESKLNPQPAKEPLKAFKDTVVLRRGIE